VLTHLGHATARAQCDDDRDAEDADLVGFQVEDAVLAAVHGREEEFVADLVGFAHAYAQVVRDDHRRFVEAFRSDRIPGVSGTA
jgi:uncharacterized protein (DUF2252 family)